MMEQTLDPRHIAEALYKRTDLFYVGSLDDEGFPNVKAVFPVNKRETLREIHFSTNTSSLRASQYRSDPKACVYYADSESFHGVMLVGTMEVLEDAEVKLAFWNEGDEQYYSQGPTDPDYCILKFTPLRGRYYHNLRTENFSID